MNSLGNNSIDKNSNGNSDLIKQAHPSDSFKGVHYNQMMDESKQTEEADISRSDFTETHSQDTIRNFQRVSDPQILTQIETIDLRKAVNQSNGQNGDAEYQNLPVEDQTNRKNRSPSKGKRKDQNNISQNVFTQEEEKTHDLIKKEFYEDEDDEDADKKNDRRVHTDSGVNGGYNGTIQNPFSDMKGNKAKIGTFSMKSHLPVLKLNAPIALSSNEIFEVFANISKAQRFQVIEMEQNIATAVNKEPFSIKRMFMRCLPFHDFKREQPNESFISAIRLQINVNEVKCCRKINLKGLYGEVTRLQDFSNAFKNKIYESVNNLPEDKKSQMKTKQDIKNSQKRKGSNNKIVTTMGNKSKGGFNQFSDDDSDSESKIGKFNETSGIYQIHKILSSESYTLGRNVAQYIEAFHLQYRSLRESASLLPQPMEGLLGLVNETVHAFHSEYNLGKETAKGLMPYCRPAVEKYVFSKLYDKLFAMYAIKNEDEDRLFVERSAIIKRMKASEVMQYLGIREKFIIGDSIVNNYSSRPSYLANMMEGKYSSGHHQRDSNVYRGLESESKDHIIIDTSGQYESHRSSVDLNIIHSAEGAGANYLFNNSSTSSSLGLGQINKNELPYIEAIKSFEKMQQFTSPREKLQCISEAFGCLKTAIVDYWKGKVELSQMDDVLPLTIYAVAMSDITHPQSELNIMEDYLSIYDKGFDLERKLLTNFDVSIKFVNKEWEFPSANN